MDLSTHQDCKLHSVTANYIHETLLYYLKEMLMRQIVSWIKFKDEDMIYSSLSPTVRVDAQQKEEFNQKKATPIDSYQGPYSSICFKFKYSWKKMYQLVVKSTMFPLLSFFFILSDTTLAGSFHKENLYLDYFKNSINLPLDSFLFSLRDSAECHQNNFLQTWF